MKYRIRKRDSYNWVLERFVEEPLRERRGNEKPFEAHWDPNPVGHYSTAEHALKAYMDKGLGDELNGACVSELLARMKYIHLSLLANIEIEA